MRRPRVLRNARLTAKPVFLLRNPTGCTTGKGATAPGPDAFRPGRILTFVRTASLHRPQAAILGSVPRGIPQSDDRVAEHLCAERDGQVPIGVAAVSFVECDREFPAKPELFDAAHLQYGVKHVSGLVAQPSQAHESVDEEAVLGNPGQRRSRRTVRCAWHESSLCVPRQLPPSIERSP